MSTVMRGRDGAEAVAAITLVCMFAFSFFIDLSKPFWGATGQAAVLRCTRLVRALFVERPAGGLDDDENATRVGTEFTRAYGFLILFSLILMFSR
jgi:hypothetical protein